MSRGTVGQRLQLGLGLAATLVMVLALIQGVLTARATLTQAADYAAQRQVTALAEALELLVARSVVVTRSVSSFYRSLPPGASEDLLAPFLVRLLRQTPPDQAYGVYVAFEELEAAGQCRMPWVDRKSLPGLVTLRYDFHDPRWEWYHGARADQGEVHVSEPYFDQDGSNVAMISLTQALFDSSGQFLGVAGTDISLTGLQALVAECRLRHGEAVSMEGEHCLLASAKGRLMACPEASWLPGPGQPARRLSQTPEGKVVTSDGSGSGQTWSDGQIRHVYWTRTARHGWTVVLSVPESVILGPAQRFTELGILVVPAALLLLLLAVGGAARMVLRPVGVLVAAVEAAQRERFRPEQLGPLLHSASEFGSLARSFAAMVAEVEVREEGLVRAQETLREREGLFRALVENSQDLIALTDPQGRITYLSPALEGLGYPPDELQDQPMQALLEDHSEPLSACQALPIRLRARSGPAVPAEMTVRALDGGRWLVICHDTRERERQRRLRLDTEAARAAHQAKSAFLASMSHELRTPLNAIIGYGEMLVEDAQAQGQAELEADLSRVVGSGKHLLALINDILDLSKIEAGKLRLFVESFPLAPVVEEVLAAIEPLRRGGMNRLVLEIPPIPSQLKTDRQRLSQVLYNLMSNACKFTRDGVVTLRVRQSADGWLELDIQDTGIGIAPQHFEQLFTPFFQVDASAARAHEGTGLGLVLSRAFCLLMGGDVVAESQLGQGTTFRVRLPILEPSP